MQNQQPGNQQFPRGIELVASALIENSQGQILLTRSPKWHNKWTLPGGHIEPGESIIEAVVRETAEETGLSVEGEAIIYWGEMINTPDFHRPAHFIFFDVYCRLVGGEDNPVKLDNHELSEYRWIGPHDALQLDLGQSYPETISAFIEYKQIVEGVRKNHY